MPPAEVRADATSYPTNSAVATRHRLIGLALLALAVPMAYVVLSPAGGRGLLAQGRGAQWLTRSMYDHSRWALVAALVIAALVIVRPGRYADRGVVAAAAISAQLMATVLYGWKHALPYTGMRGDTAWVPRLHFLAVVLAVAAFVALALCLGGLLAARVLELPASSARRSGVIASVVVALVVPVGFGLGSASTRDLTSVGAYVLLFSLPWGCALAACDVLPAPLAATAAAVTGASALGCLLLWSLASFQFVATSEGARPTLVVVALIAGWLTWRLARTARADLPR